MSAPGYRLFADELAWFAAELSEPRLAAIAHASSHRCGWRCWASRCRREHGHARPRRPRSFARRAAGVAEVVVHVIAEVVKPEDRVAIAAAGRPVLVVLNKADLAGRRCAEFAELTGAPTAPMVALLAVAALDGALWAALRLLADRPADLRSRSASAPRRTRCPPRCVGACWTTLDLFGVALRRCAAAGRVRGGDGGAAAPRQRCRRSRQRIGLARCRGALPAGVGRRAEMETLAVTDERRQRLAVQRRDGHRPDGGRHRRRRGGPACVGARDDAAAHLQRAVHWRGYGRGAVSPYTAAAVRTSPAVRFG